MRCYIKSYAEDQVLAYKCIAVNTQYYLEMLRYPNSRKEEVRSILYEMLCFCVNWTDPDYFHDSYAYHNLEPKPRVIYCLNQAEVEHEAAEEQRTIVETPFVLKKFIRGEERTARWKNPIPVRNRMFVRHHFPMLFLHPLTPAHIDELEIRLVNSVKEHSAISKPTNPDKKYFESLPGVEDQMYNTLENILGDSIVVKENETHIHTQYGQRVDFYYVRHNRASGRQMNPAVITTQLVISNIEGYRLDENSKGTWHSASLDDYIAHNYDLKYGKTSKLLECLVKALHYTEDKLVELIYDFRCSGDYLIPSGNHLHAVDAAAIKQFHTVLEGINNDDKDREIAHELFGYLSRALGKTILLREEREAVNEEAFPLWTAYGEGNSYCYINRSFTGTNQSSPLGPVTVGAVYTPIKVHLVEKDGALVLDKKFVL